MWFDQKSQDLNREIVHDGICSNVTILLGDKNRLDNSLLKWHKEGKDEFRDSYLSLQEIYEQIKAMGYQGVIYVWEDTPLEGRIYMCGNYEEGQWILHGKTSGYA